MSLLRYYELNGEGIKAAINDGEDSRDETAGVADEIMYRAEEFFWLCEATSRRMSDDSLCSVGQ